MIALRLTVPVACWRRGAAREFLETEPLPPPATCYGALLSLVGETDRARHIGARVSAGIRGIPAVSRVLRTLWRIKTLKLPMGVGNNASPDYQQLITEAEVVVLCDSSGEPSGDETLEQRITAALRDASTVERFGGWSLGESTHLINDLELLDATAWPAEYSVFSLAPDGDVTMPVWVDHVGAAGTAYAVGRITGMHAMPEAADLPTIAPNAT